MNKFILIFQIILLSISSHVFAQSVHIGENRFLDLGVDETPFVDPHITANPHNSNHLIAGVMVRSDDFYIMVLTSFDGGKSWSKQKMNNIGGDPLTLITDMGTVLMAGLGYDGTLWIYRSEDGGETWDEPQNLGKWYKLL